MNYILHELLADWTNFLAQRSAEHHNLFSVWCVAKYFLHITSHVWKQKTIKPCNIKNELPFTEPNTSSQLMQHFTMLHLGTSQLTHTAHEWSLRKPKSYTVAMVNVVLTDQHHQIQYKTQCWQVHHVGLSVSTSTKFSHPENGLCIFFQNNATYPTHCSIQKTMSSNAHHKNCYQLTECW